MDSTSERFSGNPLPYTKRIGILRFIKLAQLIVKEDKDFLLYSLIKVRNDIYEKKFLDDSLLSFGHDFESLVGQERGREGRDLS